jgi:cystathionine beta-lyase
VSKIWIPDNELRGKFTGLMDREGLGGVNRLGMIAAQAAYLGGEAWLDEVKEYMRGNLDFLRQFLREHMPEIKLVEPEGTYFAWLDCSGLGLTEKELNDRIVNRAKLWLDAGGIFGGHAKQFQRVVLACPRATLSQAAEQLKRIK